MNITLTKDTDKILCVLYKEYLSKCKSGLSKSNSKMFNSDEISNLFSKSNIEDVYDSVEELKKKHLVEMWISGEVLLNNEAIIYMENRFKNGFQEVTDFIAKFIP